MIKKNRQSITACSSLHLLLLKISYLTTLGLKMKLSNISVTYSEENSISKEVSKIRQHRIKLAEFVEGSHSIITLTHSLTQKDSIVAYT